MKVAVILYLLQVRRLNIAVNEYVNKVVYDGTTLIDLTSDTVAASDVQTGKYFHLPTGERVQGTNT